MESLGSVTIGAKTYDAELDRRSKTLFLHTFEPASKMRLTFECSQPPDIEDRWADVRKLFVRAVAEYYMK